jgi:hypothetical protein
MRKLLLPLAILVLTATAVINVGCGTSSAQSPLPPPPPAFGSPTPTPKPGPTSTPTPLPSPASTHLYLSQGSVFNLPITNASLPMATIGTNGLGMAFDASNRLFVASVSGQVQDFSQPIAAGASPAFTLATGLCPHVNTFVCEARDVAFDPVGDLFVAGSTNGGCNICLPWPLEAISFFKAPVTSSSAGILLYSQRIRGTMLGIAFDKSGDLWATDGTDLREYTPPFNCCILTPALTVVEPGVGIAFNGIGDMFVSGSSGVDVFQPPFTAAMTKAFTINAAQPRYLAFDQAGNLFVTTLAGGKLLMFSTPFSAASAPIVTLAIPGGDGLAGVAIGP